jgi:elongation factor G
MAAKPAATTPLDKFRNLGVIAHIDAGKTTTTEHLLFYAGATHFLGGVDKGNTVTDWNVEEQERGITIYSACIPFRWHDCTINLIDTPGHVDFTAEVERSLRVLDGAVVVFDAQKGVEAQSETVWRQADKYGVPRLVFVNKMDVVGANFENTVTEIRERLEGHPVPIVVPIGSGSIKDSPTPFKGVIDLLAMQALYFNAAEQGKKFHTEAIPEDELLTAEEWRVKMLDALTAHDDKLTEAVLEQGPAAVPAELIRAAIRKQTLERRIQPVLCGSGREHIGIQPLLDAVTYYLPSPLDRPPVAGVNPKQKNREEKRKPDPKEPFCGLVFKIVSNENRDLYYLRIYSGVLKPQSRPYNPGKDVKELLSKIYHTRADPTDLDDLAEGVTGDIVAVIGLKDSVTGDTLCDPQHPILLEKITFAEAVVSQSIEPESSADKDKLEKILTLLRKEDPTFAWKTDRDTGQTLMNGMGMLHLEIKRHRMERDFRLKVRVGKPRVSYRETLRRAVRVEGECVRQTAAMFAKVTVKFDPKMPPPLPGMPPGKDIKKGEERIAVMSQLPPDVIPVEYETAALNGLRSALESGELGFPVMKVSATLLEAEMNQELSSEAAFEAAGADAVHQAMRDNILLLEPVMHLEVTVPDEFYGAITGDLMARRADIRQTTMRGKLQVIDAIVPLRSMFDYADKARSLTQGRATYSLEPHSYAPAPDEVLQAMREGT